MLKNPLMLFIIIPITIIWLIPFFLRKPGVRFTSLRKTNIKAGLKSRIQYIPKILIWFVMLLLVIVLAKPVKPPQDREFKREGIAIEMVLDSSGSMSQGMRNGLKVVTKLDMVKEVVRRFVMGDGVVEGRDDDLIGLITFSRYANTIYPLTFNRKPFPDAVSSITTPPKELDGTHFGAGLQMGIARLETLKEDEETNIKGRIIIFLTDGRNVIDDIDPIEMAKLAKEKDIRIYTIAFVTRQQNQLKYISSLTGGKSFQAKNGSSLLEIYNEIDSIEKSRLGDIEPAEGEPDTFRFLMSAFVLLVLALILEWTLFRRFP